MALGGTANLHHSGGVCCNCNQVPRFRLSDELCVAGRPFPSSIQLVLPSGNSDGRATIVYTIDRLRLARRPCGQHVSLYIRPSPISCRSRNVGSLVANGAQLHCSTSFLVISSNICARLLCHFAGLSGDHFSRGCGTRLPLTDHMPQDWSLLRESSSFCARLAASFVVQCAHTCDFSTGVQKKRCSPLLCMCSPLQPVHTTISAVRL